MLDARLCDLSYSAPSVNSTLSTVSTDLPLPTHVVRLEYTIQVHEHYSSP